MLSFDWRIIDGVNWGIKKDAGFVLVLVIGPVPVLGNAIKK